MLETSKSPLTKTENIVLEQKISCDFIVDTYKSCLDMDVRKYLKSLDFINLYRCLETGYRFYYPFDLEGDSDFYEKLQIFPWYYIDWKWEFDIANQLVKSNDNVLEIGCARGVFIEHLVNKGAICTGLEFNDSAIICAQAKGLNVIKQTIQAHSNLKLESYDVICAFQVLEHVSAVKEFLDASIAALKVGGKLIVCVPNNDSFVRHEKRWPTNMPPHHMGLWNHVSLQSLPSYFPLKLEKTYFEPLNEYGWFYELQSQRIINFFGRQETISKITKNLLIILKKPSCLMLKILRKFIRGQSILAVYTKLDVS